MNTMLNIATELLNKNGAQTFDEIMDEVSLQLSPKWEAAQPGKTDIKIREVKITELYTLLTITGSFIRTDETKFDLVKNYTFEEAQAMKLKIGELEEVE